MESNGQLSNINIEMEKQDQNQVVVPKLVMGMVNLSYAPISSPSPALLRAVEKNDVTEMR